MSTAAEGGLLDMMDRLMAGGLEFRRVLFRSGVRGESGPKVLISKGRHTGTRQEGMGDREGGDGR